MTLIFLPKEYTSVECKTLDQYNQNDQRKITDLKNFYENIQKPENKDDFEKFKLGKGQYGIIFLSPHDKSKVIKYQTPAKEKIINHAILESQMGEMLSSKDREMPGQFRVAPQIYEDYCLIDSNGKHLFITVSERFRGSLEFAVKQDIRFNDSFEHFTNRLLFYLKMMESYSVLPGLGVKHCNLKPDNMLYKDTEADFEAPYDDQGLPLEYFPVLADFGGMSPLNQDCNQFTPRYTNLKDFTLNREKKEFFDIEYNILKEMFPMAMIMLYLETALLEWFKNKYKDHVEDLNKQLSMIPKTTETLKDSLKTDFPFQTINIFELHDLIIRMVGNTHSGGSNPSVGTYQNHNQIGDDVRYLFQGMRVHLKFTLTQKGIQEETINELLQVYQSFEDLMYNMVKNNKVFDSNGERKTEDKRPNPKQVIASLNQLIERTREIEGIQDTTSSGISNLTTSTMLSTTGDRKKNKLIIV